VPKRETPLQTNRAILALTANRLRGTPPSKVNGPIIASLRALVARPATASSPAFEPVWYLLRRARIRGHRYTEWTEAEWDEFVRVRVVRAHKDYCERPGPRRSFNDLEGRVSELVRLLNVLADRAVSSAQAPETAKREYRPLSGGRRVTRSSVGRALSQFDRAFIRPPLVSPVVQALGQIDRVLRPFDRMFRQPLLVSPVIEALDRIDQAYRSQTLEVLRSIRWWDDD
jgi:hypothetical protein